MPLSPSIRRILSQAVRDRPVEVEGWIKTFRKQKRVSFASLNDGSDSDGLQIVIPQHLDANGLTTGAAVSITGQLQMSPGHNQLLELVADDIELIGASSASAYPIQKRHVPATILRSNAHLRVRTHAISSMLRIRHGMSKACHDFFDSHDFFHVETPLITSSDCEGGGEAFEVVSAKSKQAAAHEKSVAAEKESVTRNDHTEEVPPATNTPAIPAKYLTVSGQLHLEALAAGLKNVYCLNPAFRAETSDTARHLQEFWMLEAESSFLERAPEPALDQVMGVCENAIKAIVGHVTTNPRYTQDFMYLYSQRPELEEQLKKTVDEDFKRIKYVDALKLIEENKDAFHAVPKWGDDLQTEHEKWLAEKHFNGPVFVTHYPTQIKPFYMLSHGKLTYSFDLLFPRVCEMAGGSLRQHDYETLKKALRSAGMDEEAYSWYLDLRRFGTTQHGGFGIGWERLVAFITGFDNVRECIAFPRAAESLKF